MSDQIQHAQHAQHQNHYLEGNFAPVRAETTAWNLDVVGTIPPELCGTYVRNGPNPITPDADSYHWFVGEGMLHGVHLEDGKATWYRNRWVRSPSVVDHQGSAPVPTQPGGLLPGPGNTNIVSHAGAMWALTELALPYRIDDELGTVAQENFGGPLPNGMNAHPKIDPATGAAHVLAYSFAEPWLLYHEISPEGQVVRTEQLDVGGPVMVHETGLTERWVIVLDLPVTFDADLLAQGRRLPYSWDPEYTPRVGLMPRSGTSADTIWIEVEPCYVFHTLNCYDDGDQVVMEFVRHPSMFRTDLSGPNEGAPVLARWRLDPITATAKSELLDQRPQEFPRFDERRTGLPYRYGYTSEMAIDDLAGGIARTTRVLKYDWASGIIESHDMGPGRTAGEVMFVPASEDAGEDEGWLIGYVHDAGRDQSDLVIIDSRDMAVAPVAKIQLPVRVPAGFHGNWFPS